MLKVDKNMLKQVGFFVAVNAAAAVVQTVVADKVKNLLSRGKRDER